MVALATVRKVSPRRAAQRAATAAMVPEQPTATSKPMSRASRATWATNDLIWRRQALTAPSAITPPSKKRSVSRMWPSLRLRASAAGAWSPTISSVEPPPMSMTM